MIIGVLRAQNNNTAAPLKSVAAKVSTVQRQPSQEQDETAVPLKEHVARFARKQERRAALKLMKQCLCLQYISLDSPSISTMDNRTELDLERFEKHLVDSSFSINGILIERGSSSTKTKTELFLLLTRVCDKLMAECGHTTTTNTTQLYRDLILRLAGIPSQTDAHAELEELLVSGPDCTDQAPHELPPGVPLAAATVYTSGGHIHATFGNQHAYGLYLADMDPREPKLKTQNTNPIHYL